MLNIAKALFLGSIVFSALFFTALLSLGESVVPGVLAAIAVFYFFARRSFKAVETIFQESMINLQKQPPKFDLAISAMEKAYDHAKDQIGIRTTVDNQIGVTYFLKQDFNKALPYLQRSLGFGHWMGGAMLGVIHYKKKNHDEMRKTFDIVLKRGKKQGLAWNLYAYLLCQIGERDTAMSILVQGVKKTKDDERVKESLLAIQNGKKMKMRGYKEQWYQFHLERPPVQYQQAAMGGKMNKGARRGRW